MKLSLDNSMRRLQISVKILKEFLQLSMKLKLNSMRLLPKLLMLKLLETLKRLKLPNKPPSLMLNQIINTSRVLLIISISVSHSSMPVMMKNHLRNQKKNCHHVSHNGSMNLTPTWFLKFHGKLKRSSMDTSKLHRIQNWPPKWETMIF